MLKDRVITAILLLAALLGAVFLLPAAGWMVVCAALCATAAWEWGGLARFERPLRMTTAIVFGVTCLMVGFLAGLGDGSLSGAILLIPLYIVSALFWVLVVPVWLVRKWSLSSPTAASFIGFTVLIPTALAMMHLRTIGPWVLLGAMAVVWVADIAAYFSGRALGRHKLAPNISPGKTWEGAAGAALAVLLFGFGILVAFGARQPGGALVIDPGVADQLVQAIEEVIANPAAAAERAERGRHWVEADFLRDDLARKMSAFLERVVRDAA